MRPVALPPKSLVLTLAVALIGFGAACGDSGKSGGDAADNTDAADTADAADTRDTFVAPDTFPTPDTVDDATPDTGDADMPDTIGTSDVAHDTAVDVPDADVVPDESLCSAPGGDLNVYDLQDPACPDHPSPEPITTAEAIPVDLSGLVITGTFGDTFTAEDPRGGPYSGITIFNHGMSVGATKVGDQVDVSGSYYEYFGNTQVYLAKLTKTGTAPVPEPFYAERSEWLATGGQLAEMFEAVLVQVRDVYTTDTQPDCPNDYGEFEVNLALRVDDMGFKWNAPDGARLGDHFASITGPLLWAFGNTKVEPRDANDVVVIDKGDRNGITKCIANACRERDDAPVTRSVVINEVMADPMGDDTYQEWIELYNPASQPVNLAGWAVRDCGDQLTVLNGQGTSIDAHGYLVIGMSTDSSKNGAAPVDFAYGVDGFYLPNTVGSVLLYDGQTGEATLVDQMRYSRFAPWTVLATGKSLERVSPSSDGTQPDSWKTGSSSYGDNGNQGTPGKHND